MEDKRHLDAIFRPSIRELLESANNMGIHKEDIVDILKEEKQFFMIFEVKK